MGCYVAGRISALQFQAVRLACQKHETFLPDGSRAGFFLGDGEPVGLTNNKYADTCNLADSNYCWVLLSTALSVQQRIMCVLCKSL